MTTLEASRRPPAVVFSLQPQWPISISTKQLSIAKAITANIPVNKITGRLEGHTRNRDATVGIVTGYGLEERGVGIRVPVGARIFSSTRRPDRFWGPTSILSNVCQGSFRRGKMAGVRS
jgi:hypothetical protein